MFSVDNLQTLFLKCVTERKEKEMLDHSCCPEAECGPVHEGYSLWLKLMMYA